MKITIKKIAVFFLTFVWANFVYAQQENISLAGKWCIALDGNFKDWPFKTGETEKWFQKELPTNESLFLLNQIYFKNADFKTNNWINLPGTTDEADIGIVLQNSSQYTFGLERVYTYDGAFWVQRMITIPKDWEGKQVTLFLERTLGSSTIFWDNQKVGSDYGYAVPHQILIDKSVESGEHRITMLINKDDVRYAHTGHHNFAGNGASWNGIIGKMELIAKNATAHISDIQVYPKIKNQSIDVKILLFKENNHENKKLKIFLRKGNEDKFGLLKSIDVISDSLMINCELPKPISLWNEFTPNLYQLEVILEDNGTDIDSNITTFGMREIGKLDGYITINNNKVTMRGTLDNGSHPLTGYPYMQKYKWLEIFKIIKSYGLNHVRFHTWCPPNAAFDAADELGLYLQVELAGSPYSEINRLLQTYGNHPSFCMLSLGNEVMGNTEWNEKVVANAKLIDNRHLYACTTHPVGINRNDDFFISAWGVEKTNEWPFAMPIVGITWGGGDVIHASRFNLFPPETSSDFSSEIKGLNVPIIAHEMGQWAMFPDFDEIEKYKKGVLRNTNYERIKLQNEKRGIHDQNKQFVLASGMFSSILYKEEIESVLRTQGYAGFQLLGLQDYQGQHIAVVGLLNDFWESKGLVSPRQHSQYCNSIVPLAQFEKRVWKNNETFKTKIVVSNFTLNDYNNIKLHWKLLDADSNAIKQGVLNSQTIKKGTLTSYTDLQIPLVGIKKASKLLLNISIPELNIQNSWEIWVYPEKTEVTKGDVYLVEAQDLQRVEKLLQDGKKVLLQLDDKSLKTYRESCFTTIFWNSILKWPQKSHTMGIVCNPKHQIFTNFPTEFHSNWQWWDIAMNAFAMDISSLPKELTPLVQVIDSYTVNTKLAYLWECRVGNGKLMVSTINFTDNLENRPASKRLKSSVLNYMNSNQFNPSIIIDFTRINELTNIHLQK